MKRTKKEILFSVATLLIVIGLVITIPIAYALSNNNNDEKIEIISERDQFTKHFKNGDGTVTAVSYPTPVHYQTENGTWEDIDNTIEPSKGRSSNELLVLKENPFINVSFYKETQKDKIIEVNVDGNYLSWGIENVKKSTSEVLEKGTSKDAYNLTNLVSTVKYADALDKADLYYSVSSTNLKEEIIIKEKSSIKDISYIITTNLNATKTDHNLVIFKNSTDETIYTFQNPYMYDSAEKSSTNFNTTVDLEKVENGYRVTYHLDANWLESNDRVYPIVIDPIVTNGRDQTNVLDTYVHPGDSASHNHVNEDRLWVGKVNGTSRAFINWANLPSINGNIISSHVSFNFFKGTSSWGPLEIWQVNNWWSSSNLTWDAHNNLSKTQLLTNLYPSVVLGFQNFSLNVTNSVKAWYNNTLGKNGFMVKYANENYNDYNTLVSSDGGLGSDFWPCLYIDYSPTVPQPTAYVTAYYSYGNQKIGSSFYSSLRSMGYNASFLYNVTAQNIKDNLSKDIIVYAGHGNHQILTVGDAGVSYYNYDATLSVNTGEDPEYKNRSYVGLGQYNLSNVKLMILAGCETADLSFGSDWPIARRVADNFGAKASIGWTESFLVDKSWVYMDNLMSGFSQGKGVQDAINYADAFYYSDNSLTSSWAYGDTSTKINLSGKYQTLSEKMVIPVEKGPIFYEINKTDNATRSNEIIAEEYIHSNIDKNFTVEDFELEYLKNGKLIKYTYAPFGIRTFNNYTIYLEDDKITKISDYTPDNLIDVKEKLKNVKLKSEKEKMIIKEEFLKNTKGNNLSVIKKDGYEYENNKVRYFLLISNTLANDIKEEKIIYFDL